MIDKNQFINIIKSTPLVSIDLIIQDNQRRFLLGKRVNRPAKGYWFVPGGRIMKNETVSDAFKRVSFTETGNNISIFDASLLGVYDHIYNDNVFAKKGINTHYVVLAYLVKLQEDLEIFPDTQHSEIKWWTKNNLLKSSDVHQNTKAYFFNT